MSTVELPAVCPLCGGELYIDVNDDTTDDETVDCAYCGEFIKIGEAVDEYRKISRRNAIHAAWSGLKDTNRLMSLIKYGDADIDAFNVNIVTGRQDIAVGVFHGVSKMYFSRSLPGILWFDRNHTREYEVLDYWWDGPGYSHTLIQENKEKTETEESSGASLAGALIGTAIMPGLGTIIGASLGSSSSEVSKASTSTTSYIESVEVPVAAHMRLRDLQRDQVINISFACTSELDARIRNNITSNFEAAQYLDYDEPVLLQEPEPEPEIIHEEIAQKPSLDDLKDVIAQLRELKQLLDDGIITEEEFSMLKKKYL